MLNQLKALLFTVLIVMSDPTQAQKNYIDYHLGVQKAEQYLFQDQLDSCMVQYRNIFSSFPKTFARDAFIAFQVACMAKDTAHVSFFFERSVANGIVWEPITYCIFYQNLIQQDPLYKKRLEELYTVAHKQYEQSIDTTIRNKILNLLEHDDQTRTNTRDSVEIRRWFRVMDQNGQILDSIIHRIGYPGEHRAGILHAELEMIEGPERKAIGVRVQSVPSRIFYHNDCTFQDVKKEMLQAIRDGEITPKEYALIHEWSFDALMRPARWWDPYYKFPCNRPVQKVKQYNFYLNPFNYSKDTQFVNACRAEIGMCTLEHQQKLITYAAAHQLLVKFGFGGSY